jgi:hypothetical protein
MKTTACFFVLMAAIGALMPGTSQAWQQTAPASTTNTAAVHRTGTQHSNTASSGNRHTEGKTSDRKPDSHKTSGKTPPRGPVARATRRPKQLPNNKEHFAPEKNGNLRLPDSLTSRGATNGGPNQEDTLHSAALVRPLKGIRPALPSLNNSRHHEAYPSTIGGPANSASRTTVAISGTDVHRRP